MNFITIFGLVAAALTTVAYLPQTLKTIKTKQTRNLSLITYIILTTGVFLWLIYGFIIKDIPIVASNIPIFICSLVVLIFKLKYK